jgi:hypothetical protein
MNNENIDTSLLKIQQALLHELIYYKEQFHTYIKEFPRKTKSTDIGPKDEYYICRANFLLSKVEMKIAELTLTGGGNNKYKYKEKTYNIHFGSRGGKYIVVGKDKEKIYI